MRATLILLAALAPALPVHAQALADVCRPVEAPVTGGWARYRLRGTGDSTEMRLALVGTASWGGSPHVWQESLVPTPAGETVIQSLVPSSPYDPTAVRRAVMRAPGQASFEVPASALAAMRQRAQGSTSLDACRTGQAVGWETLEVPAGRVRALHVRYARAGRTADVWLAPAIPFALVRSLVPAPDGAGTIELVLIGHGADAVPTVPPAFRNASMTAHGFINLHVVEHPLVRHKLTRLRDRHTGTRDFKALVNELAMLMAYEATSDLPLDPVPVETPLERTEGVHLAGKKLALVPILRAGLGMVDGITHLVPHARIGHIGMYRDEDTLEPVDYYFKIPGAEDDRLFLVLDPMLATGGSAVQAMRALKDAGATRIRLLCLIAAPEGVRRMLETHPDVPIHTAALDRGLDERGFIRPGLGDAGDRLFGTQ